MRGKMAVRLWLLWGSWIWVSSQAYGHSLSAGPWVTAGWTHAFSGWDHMMAMVAVGLWASRTQGWSALLYPLAFLSSVLLGGILAHAGFLLPGTEAFVMMSVLGLGLVLLLGQNLPRVMVLGGMFFFGAFHGHAHGTEMALSGALSHSFTGFALGTALLHVLGIGVGKIFLHYGLRWAFQAAGSFMVLAFMISFLV